MLAAELEEVSRDTRRETDGVNSRSGCNAHKGQDLGEAHGSNGDWMP